jgi:hypothetical protein
MPCSDEQVTVQHAKPAISHRIWWSLDPTRALADPLQNPVGFIRSQASRQAFLASSLAVEVQLPSHDNSTPFPTLSNFHSNQAR